jgi:hypothetical protein
MGFVAVIVQLWQPGRLRELPAVRSDEDLKEAGQ